MNTEETSELVQYEFKTKKGVVTIGFEHVIEHPKFKIQGPTELIQKAIGGLGFENQEDTITTATEVHLDTEAKRMYAILETLKAISKSE